MPKRTMAPMMIVLTRINTPAPARMPSLTREPSGVEQMGHAMIQRRWKPVTMNSQATSTNSQ